MAEYYAVDEHGQKRRQFDRYKKGLKHTKGTDLRVLSKTAYEELHGQ